LRHFGGVTEVLVLDNMKAAVTKAAEPVNENGTLCLRSLGSNPGDLLLFV